MFANLWPCTPLLHDIWRAVSATVNISLLSIKIYKLKRNVISGKRLSSVSAAQCRHYILPLYLATILSHFDEKDVVYKILVQYENRAKQR